MTAEGLVLDIDLRGVEETTANIKGFPNLLSQELNIAMELSLQLLERQVSTRAPKNFGTLRSSINHQIISQFPNLVGSVGTPKEYGIVMEYGSKPYKEGRMPPVDAIRIWAVRKLGLSGDEADSAAWAIAKHIAKHGIEGLHYFKEGFEASEPHINQLFNSAVGRATARANR